MLSIWCTVQMLLFCCEELSNERRHQSAGKSRPSTKQSLTWLCLRWKPREIMVCASGAFVDMRPPQQWAQPTLGRSWKTHDPSDTAKAFWIIDEASLSFFRGNAKRHVYVCAEDCLSYENELSIPLASFHRCLFMVFLIDNVILFRADSQTKQVAIDQRRAAALRQECYTVHNTPTLAVMVLIPCSETYVYSINYAWSPDYAT